MAGLSTGSAKAPLADRGNDLARVWEALSYDPATGEFVWRRDRANRKAGDLAGNIGPNGYRTIMVDYRSYYAHHLAIAHATGALPPKGAHVDHINGDKADNRQANLRVVTPSRNGLNRKTANRNNRSGTSGVFQTRSGRFLAFVGVDGKRRNLGTFPTFEEAKAAREAALNGLA